MKKDSPTMPNRSTLKRLLRHAKPHGVFIALSLFFGLLQVSAQLLAPVFMGRAIDYIRDTRNVDFGKVSYYVLLMAGCIAAVFIFQYLMNLFAAVCGHRTVRDIRVAVFKKLNRVPLKETDKFSYGNLLSRLTSDTDKIADGLVQGFTQLFAGVGLVAGTLGFMLYINAIVALAVAVITPFSVLATFFIARAGQRMFMRQAKLEGELSGLTEEYVTNLPLVKLFNFQQSAEAEFDELNRGVKKYGTKAVFISAIVNPSTRLINGYVYACVCVVSAFLILKTDAALTVGALGTFLSYALQYAKPFNEISGVITEMQTALVSSRRVFEILDLSDESGDAGLPELAAPDGNVEFKDVSFSYTDAPFIEGFNLSARQGSRVAIVGKTGCGKTTLLSLIMRFYETDGGVIAVDGTDIKSVTRSSLRRNIGMVLQDTWIFHGTIAENIAYGKPDATRAEIEEAAKRARLDGLIGKLPSGYDTVITPGLLSQGQMQLVSIARVFLALPPLLILDEATSSIDARTELKIQEALKEMTEGHTSFIVAHRLSTIKNADLILVMDSGRVVESGVHSELKAKGGLYASFLSGLETNE